MSKRTVSVVIVALVAVFISVLLFMPKAPAIAPTHEARRSSSKSVLTTASTTSTTTQAAEATSSPKQAITIIGTFLGLADGKDHYLGAFKYAVIDDGTEVQQIDLRSIVGYDVVDLQQKLGVQKGQEVRITGYMKNGAFVATTLHPTP